MAAVALLHAAAANAQQGPASLDDCAEVYRVHALSSPPRIEGVLDDGEWPAELWETGLVFPWRERAAPRTAFAVASHAGDLYFAFRVVDHDVVLAEGDPGDESLIERGDRVELFLARDRELDEYYSIEVDPLGRVLDYRGRFYRRFERGWDCPGLEVAATRRADGYAVEGRLPRSALRAMGLTAPEGDFTLRAGVFRAEFSHRPDAPPDPGWISWVRPVVPEPDFHVPSAFGCLRPADEP